MTPIFPPNLPVWQELPPEQQRQLHQLLTRLISHYMKAARTSQKKEVQNEPAEQN